MGIHGNATCVMAYENAKGWLIGEENRGMPAMFVMMNEARLGTGLQGLAIGDAAYQAAVEFAKDRLQGRSPDRAEEPGRPGRPDHRPPGRAPHADGVQGLSSRAAAPSSCGPRCRPTCSSPPGRGRAPEGQATTWA